MNTLLISYDLITPGKDYSRLYEYLRDYAAYCKPLESVWLIKTSKNCPTVKDELVDYTDRNDKIFVVDITGKASALRNFPQNVVDWIKS
ncbi:MAG: CRISPR-associated protein Cas2 [Patescibacteria group bacterium]|jgi:hypothetical protein